MTDTNCGIIVQPVEREDFRALLPLLLEMGHSDSQAGVLSRLGVLVRERGHFIPIALGDNEVVGYAWAQDYGPHLRSGLSVVRLHDLYVTPERRRRGIGRRLFKAVMCWAGERGSRWMQWQAGQEALPFYHELGFDGDPCPDREHPFFEVNLV